MFINYLLNLLAMKTNPTEKKQTTQQNDYLVEKVNTSRFNRKAMAIRPICMKHTMLREWWLCWCWCLSLSLSLSRSLSPARCVFVWFFSQSLITSKYFILVCMMNLNPGTINHNTTTKTATNTKRKKKKTLIQQQQQHQTASQCSSVNSCSD